MAHFDGKRRSFFARLFPALGSLAMVPMLSGWLFAGPRRYYRRRVRVHRRRLRRYYRSRSYSSYSYPSYSYPSYSDHYRRGPIYRGYAPRYGGYYRRVYPVYPRVEVHVGAYGYRGYGPVYGRSSLDLLEY